MSAVVAGCGEVTVAAPPSMEPSCVWRAQEPVTIAAHGTQELEMVVSLDGERVSLVYTDADASWMTRWAWRDALTEPQMLSERSAWAIGQGPADEMTVLVLDDAGEATLFEENGLTTPLGLGRVPSEVRPIALGPMARDGARTLLLASVDGADHVKAVRIRAGHVSTEAIGCGGRKAAILMGDHPLVALEGRAPLGACGEPRTEQPQMIEVVSLTDGHDVRHVERRRDVEFLDVGAIRLAEHGDGLSLFWQDAAACGYCWDPPYDHAFLFQPLDAEGREAGLQQEIPITWDGAVAGVGDRVAVLERGDRDRIHLIGRDGIVAHSVATAGSWVDVEYDQLSPSAMAAHPDGDIVVAAWTRAAGEVVVQAFACTL